MATTRSASSSPSSVEADFLPSASIESNKKIINEAVAKSPTWQEINGCELILSASKPTKENLEQLNITHAAYVRYNNELYYVNKKTHECSLLKIKEEQLLRFDYELQTIAKANRKLTDKELALIELITGHLHRTRWQKVLHWFGIVCSAIIAVGSGISTAGAFITLNLLTGGLATVVAALIFVAGTAVNWWLFKRFVSPVLIDLFGREKFLIDEEGEPLSLGKKIAMGIALMLSLSVGATFAALTYSSTFALSTAFTFLAVISPAFPPLAAVLAGVTFICLTALMIKDIAQLIKKKDVIGECKHFLKNLVSTDPSLPQNKGKSRGRILAERITTVVLTALFLPLAAFGLYMTMNACVPGVKAFLLEKIPHASVVIVDVVSKVLALGLAFGGQLAFVAQSIFQAVSNIFSPKETDKKQTQLKKESGAAKAWRGVKISQVLINGFGNGLISMMGAVGSLFLGGIALVSGAGMSILAGLSGTAATPDNPKLPERTVDDLHLTPSKWLPSSMPYDQSRLKALLPSVTISSGSHSGLNTPVGENASSFFSPSSSRLSSLKQERALEQTPFLGEKPKVKRTVTYARDDMPVKYLSYSKV